MNHLPQDNGILHGKGVAARNNQEIPHLFQLRTFHRYLPIVRSGSLNNLSKIPHDINA